MTVIAARGLEWVESRLILCGGQLLTIGAFFYITFVGNSDRIIEDQRKEKKRNPSVFPKPQSIGLDVLAGQITPRNAYLTRDNHSCSNTNTIIQKIITSMIMIIMRYPTPHKNAKFKSSRGANFTHP